MMTEKIITEHEIDAAYQAALQQLAPHGRIDAAILEQARQLALQHPQRIGLPRWLRLLVVLSLAVLVLWWAWRPSQMPSQGAPAPAPVIPSPRPEPAASTMAESVDHRPLSNIPEIYPAETLTTIPPFTLTLATLTMPSCWRDYLAAQPEIVTGWPSAADAVVAPPYYVWQQQIWQQVELAGVNYLLRLSPQGRAHVRLPAALVDACRAEAH